MANVGVVGLGYIGLPTCGLLASKGFKILGIDIQAHIVDTINSGRIHIHENGLEELIRTAVASGRSRPPRQPVRQPAQPRIAGLCSSSSYQRLENDA